MNKKLIRKMLTASGGPLFPWLLNTEWVDNWKFRTTPASRSRVLSGKGVETDKQYTERRKKETTKRTWRSDAADVAHGIGKGVLALNPYTAIPYFGAKVGLDFLNGNVGWHTALNASVPLFHMAPQAVGLKEATNVALEDAANAGSKTARNWRVAREINLATKNKPKYTRVPSKNLFRTKVYKGGEIEDPYSNFLTTDPKYAANYGKVSPYIFESKSVAKAKEPMMGSSDPVTMDMFVYNNTKGNPNATAIIGHDKVTGEFAPSRGIEIYSMSPTNLFKINNSGKGKIFTGFEEQQRLLDMLNNSHNTSHPPIYERVSYSKYSADAANPKERDLVIQHFKSRYPNSGLQITTPLKISGFTYDNLLTSQKQGGKMNILEFLKNGSGIHIKEKNKGKFTSYCGGKVTDECILKGKNSSNPAIRKRATFALNARHFKHKSGGLLKFEDGGKNAAPSTKFLSKLWFKNTGNNIGSFLTSDTGKGLLDIGLNILSGYTDYRNASNLLDSLVEQSKASLELSYLDMMLEAMKNRILKLYLLKKLWQLAYLNGETLDNYSDIVASNMGWKEYSLSLLNAEQLKKQLEALIDLLAKQAKGNALGGLFGSVVQSGLGVLGNVLGNKNSTTTQNLLNNSTIGKSTNPYMYTGLGANYNASTFFK